MRRQQIGIARVAVVVIVVVIVLAGVASYVALQTTTRPTSSQSTSLSSSTTSITTQSSSQTSATQSVPNPTKLVYDYTINPTSLDPDQWTDDGSNFIQLQCYEHLFDYLPGSPTLVPWLAQNYTVSSDGLTYTINLRKGITFMDGTPFNASVVVFSANRDILKDSSTTDHYGLFGAAPGLIKGSYYFSHTFGKGSSSYNQSQVDVFMNSHAVVVGSNPYQVIFHLGFASAAFLSNLKLGVPIVDPSYIIAHWNAPTDGHGYITGITAGEPDSWMENHVMCTGPFSVKSWDKTTGNVVLTSNPNYWGSPTHSGPSTLTEIDLNYVQSDSARVLDLKSGAADIADVTTANYFAFIDKNSWLDNHVIKVTVSGIQAPGPFARNDIHWIGFNFVIHNSDGSVSSFQPQANRNFRVAMADAVNITAVVHDASFGFGTVANEMLPPGTIGYNKSIPTFWNYNLNDAKGNLTLAAQQLGFSPSHPQTTSIAYLIGDSTGEAVATQMATNINNLALGITIEPVPLPNSILIGQLVAGQIGMYILYFPNPVTDPDSYITAFGLSQEAAFQGYNNTVVKSLVVQQSAELNSAVRLRMINQIQYLMNKDVFEVWLYYPTVLGQSGQLFRTWVHGFSYNAGQPQIFFYGLSKG